ncbi:hypothetical protein D3C71_1868120 [compost metagenome]
MNEPLHIGIPPCSYACKHFFSIDKTHIVIRYTILYDRITGIIMLFQNLNEFVQRHTFLNSHNLVSENHNFTEHPIVKSENIV